MSTTNGERYWLLKRSRCRSLAASKRWTVDHFVCCEVPAEVDTAVALEVFTSREGAEAELRGMERLESRGGLLGGTYESGGRLAGGELKKAASEEVVELLESELLQILQDSDLAYVLINPPPIDGPIPGRLSIRDATTFAGELRRHLLGTLRREHV